MEQVSIGNILTILVIIIGLVIQYIAIMMKFTERITKVETKQDSLKEAVDKSNIKYENDINQLFKMTNNIVKNCEHVKD